MSRFTGRQRVDAMLVLLLAMDEGCAGPNTGSVSDLEALLEIDVGGLVAAKLVIRTENGIELTDDGRAEARGVAANLANGGAS